MNALQPPPAINPLTFIDRIIAEIELTPTQFENAERSYNAIAAVLNKPESPIRIYSPRIQPQGSMRIGTTVRPPQRKEFDLDMLCLLLVLGKGLTPHDVYEWVWNALGTDETYRSMRERRCRCIRINYSDTFRFHLDVTPAIPDWNKQSDTLFIPDRQQASWCSTHPIGFAESFFKPVAERMPVYQSDLVEAERSFAAANAVEPLPCYGVFEKKPLQRIVQMLKHDRDNHYLDTPELIPSSILLTTITARTYAAEVGIRVTNLLEFVHRIVSRLPTYIDVVEFGGHRRFSVPNPVNREENFAEKWTDAHYNEFRSWHSKVVTWLATLRNTRGKGADVMLTELSARLDKQRVIRAANSVGIDTRRLQEAERIRVDKKGTLGLIGTTVPRTINFGA